MSIESVASRRAPAWTRDEVVLVCSLLVENAWQGLATDEPRIVELSKFIRSLSANQDLIADARFRNVNGVRRKMEDLRTRHPDYSGRRTHGSKLDDVVVREFLTRPLEMQSIASAIRASAQASPVNLEDLDLTMSAFEGAALERAHLARDRSQKLRDQKIRAVVAADEPVACEVCQFDFGRFYGQRGESFIEVHHRLPLHKSGPIRTRLADLALLCSNCHRMIHRHQPWLTIEQLKAIVLAQQLNVLDGEVER